MGEHPILFAGPMIRAILAGRKTQTRRIVRRPPDVSLCGQVTLADGEEIGEEAWWFRTKDGDLRPLRRPFGVAGDTLWVRETHAILDSCCWPDLPHRQGPDGRWAFYREGFDRAAPRWFPSIHMPRWASRLTLRVLSVRVERLHEITEQDAIAEGVTRLEAGYCGATHAVKGTPKAEISARAAFAGLWDQINGKRAPWASDPWVWVVTFEVHNAS